MRNEFYSFASYQGLVRLTIQTTDSITGTSTSTPTTVASAAPEYRPKTLMAAATVRSKKLLAPIHHWAATPGQQSFYNSANVCAAAAIVSSISASVCACDTKPASNADGAR